jgi:hypothetical protein
VCIYVNPIVLGNHVLRIPSRQQALLACVFTLFDRDLYIEEEVSGRLLYTILLLLQSALQPLWAEYSQQEGFYRMPLPAARQTPNLEDQ